MVKQVKKMRKYFIHDAGNVLTCAWSMWVAAFWGALGAIVVVLSALLYQHFDWRIGVLLIAVSASLAVARVLKQPGVS